MENLNITEEDIKLSFDFRDFIELTKGDEARRKHWAIPITDEEVKAIKKAVRKKDNYKGINSNNFVSIGDPDSPTKVILNLLPYININQGIKDSFNRKDNAFREVKKSYYYPPTDKFPTVKDHAIPFEDAHTLWNYYKGLLMRNTKYNKVVIIKM